MEQYGTLIGDMNPIHIGDSFKDGRKLDSKNKECDSSRTIIVHGMLTASLFSSIFGTLIPGELIILEFELNHRVISPMVVTCTRITLYFISPVRIFLS